MAKYTIELRRICELYGREEVENWFKSYDISDYLTPIQIEVLEKNKVWSKDHLAKKIVDHYFMREIGFETPALFKHYALVTMQEIMEKYLLLIYTKFLEYDPLSSVDYDETYTREIEGEAQNTGNSKSNSSGEQLRLLSQENSFTFALIITGLLTSSTVILIGSKNSPKYFCTNG